MVKPNLNSKILKVSVNHSSSILRSVTSIFTMNQKKLMTGVWWSSTPLTSSWIFWYCDGGFDELKTGLERKLSSNVLFSYSVSLPVWCLVLTSPDEGILVLCDFSGWLVDSDLYPQPILCCIGYTRSSSFLDTQCKIWSPNHTCWIGFLFFGRASQRLIRRSRLEMNHQFSQKVYHSRKVWWW